jgi:hypothetical protein
MNRNLPCFPCDGTSSMVGSRRNLSQVRPLRGVSWYDNSAERTYLAKVSSKALSSERKVTTIKCNLLWYTEAVY